jgi:hypothetical protein
MVSSIGSPANGGSAVSTTRDKIAKLARLHLELSACQERLSAVERQGSAQAVKESDEQALTAKIAAIKAQIAELARSDASPAARAAEERDELQNPRTRRAESSPLDAVRLALVKEGHLGTLVNLRT